MTHAAPLDALAQGGRSANPLVVEVTRGDMVESRHRASFQVRDADGGVVLSAGDVAQPIYGRSAIKPLQALPLIETGAAERYGLGDVEIALACASHNGEPAHVAAVAAWLARIGCTAADLECGPQLPYDEPSLVVLIGAGGRADAAHNNCSGKHTGFLSTARHLGEPTKGYIRLDHPVQARIVAVLEELGGRSLGHAPTGIDGCGIPTIGMPLDATALAMARMADPEKLAGDRRDAARRIIKAMTGEPFMVAGSRRFCTEIMSVLGPKAAIKTGAEGVFTAMLPEQGLGIALKVDDGAGRAAEVVMGALLRHFGLIDAAAERRLGATLAPPVVNRAGLRVGQVRPAGQAPF